MVQTRRAFVGAASRSALGLCVSPLLVSAGCGSPEMVASEGAAGDVGQQLRIPPEFPAGALAANPATQVVWPSSTTRLLTFGGVYPSPTIRAVSGETFSLRLRNELPEPTNVHWHGLVAPPDMDGHPADVLAPGGSRDYAFAIGERAGVYWYHPHPDRRTGYQVYSGMAGFFLVSDPEERSLGLPEGERDVPLLLQDRRSFQDRSFSYAPTAMDLMAGYLGDVPLANGTPDAFLSVSASLYRLRLLNGSNARVFRIALDSGSPLFVIGTDGGLLERPVRATAVDLGPGERLDVLVDFSSVTAGGSVRLKSLAFAPRGGMGMGGAQGAEMTLLRFDVTRPGGGLARIPERLATIERLAPEQAKVRGFLLQMGMPPGAGSFLINGRSFSPARVDFQVRRGETEVWEVTNASTEPHPFHVHGAPFQVLQRSSGALGPQDLGWKDTVLTWPNETVRLVIRFTRHAGLYVLHCHNLEHEDAGMMLNLEVV